MRTIRFRAWDEQNKIMHNDFQFIKSGDEGNDWIVFTSDKQTLQDSTHHFENPYFGQQLKIMEYTGLKDKNGKEIYEGDVTKHHSHNTISKWIYSSRYLQFMSLESDGTHRYYFDIDKDKLEVIGNIYQNPELMEVE